MRVLRKIKCIENIIKYYITSKIWNRSEMRAKLKELNCQIKKKGEKSLKFYMARRKKLLRCWKRKSYY